MLSGIEIRKGLRDRDDGNNVCMRETKVNYRTGESLDIRSVNLFIGIESREEPRDQK